MEETYFKLPPRERGDRCALISGDLEDVGLLWDKA